MSGSSPAETADALGWHRETFPDDPQMCGFPRTAGWSNSFVGATIGADSLDTWSRGLERFNAVRATQNPAQFCDVDYFALIKEPLRTVEEIYAHFGIELTDEARTAITHTDDESKKGPRASKHTYSLADYGLTEDQVKDRFRGL